MFGSLSNEGRIAKALAQLGCPQTNFAKLANIPKTAFLNAMHGLPGCALSDETAQKALSFIERLWELQTAVDQLAKAHLPLDWGKYDQIGDALVVFQAKEICLETGDHQLDQAAEHALKATRSAGSGS
jgi:hypothetical protein